MSKHSKNCDCDQCFRAAVVSSVDRWIEKTVKENPGVVCPFCGTNPSKPASKYGSGFKDECGHEVRVKGLVIGWRKTKGSEVMRCTNSGETRELIYIKGKWIERSWILDKIIKLLKV